MTYFASSVPGLMIFVHLATWRDTNSMWDVQLLRVHGSKYKVECVNHPSGAIEQPCDLLWTVVQLRIHL